MAKKTKATNEWTEEYTETICRALCLRKGGELAANQLRKFGQFFFVTLVRRPNDFSFDANGGINMRWFDTEDYGSSQRHVSLYVSGQPRLTIRGRTDRDGRYQQDSGINITHLCEQDVTKILPVLIDVVDSKE